MATKILLSAGETLNANFYKAALEFCGCECYIKYLPEFSEEYDALVLCGGGDIDPSYYGKEDPRARGIDRSRDAAEIALIKAFSERKKPILGICRGHQIINVFFGGSLKVEVEDPSIHSLIDGDAVHTVSTLRKGFVSELYGDKISVNSSHHQALDEIGEGLFVTHICDADGNIEAVEHETLPVIGVQWHPERMCLEKRRNDTCDGIEIFKSFVSLCEK